MKSALRSTKAPSRRGVWMGLLLFHVFAVTSGNTYILYNPTRSVLCSFHIINFSINHRGIYLDKKHLTETITLKTCRECGECCRNFAFAKLSQLEIETIEAFTGLHFSKFTYPIGADGEGRFLKFTDNGDCFFLNKDEDTFSCSIYEVRSKICREYPSNKAQIETCDMNKKGIIPPYLQKKK